MKDNNIDNIKDQLRAGRNILITGSAGTGKTWAINKIAEDPAFKLSKTALTGIAALHIDGDTINRFAGLGIENKKEAANKIVKKNTWNETKKRITEAQIIVVDEISMMRPDVLELMNSIFKIATGKNDVFGGKQILFSGDFLQIPPVYRGRKNKELTSWAFQSPVWAEANIFIQEFTKIKRQENEEFAFALNEIRLGQCSKSTEDIFLSRQIAFSSSGRGRTIKLYAKNKGVDKINHVELYYLKGKTKLFKGTVWGASKWNKDRITSDCLAPKDLFLKLGAQVMTLINDKEARFRNGSMGTVVGYSVDNDGLPTVVVEIEKTGQKINIGRFQWQRKDYSGEVVASFSQYPLKLAYAITIHKSQGMSLDSVEIDCKDIFSDGQLYVALSRITDLQGLFLKNWNKKYIKTNAEALKFYESIKSGD